MQSYFVLFTIQLYLMVEKTLTLTSLQWNYHPPILFNLSNVKKINVNNVYL